VRWLASVSHQRGAPMTFTETALRGAFIIDLEPHADARGFFARSFCQHEFAAHGLELVVAQTNIAFNFRRGTIRGLHFQWPPAAGTKLVRCTRGAILDVIVDLRPESPTYLQHVAVEVTAANRRALYIPKRFAHGYQVLRNRTEATYQMGEFYAPASEGGLRYSDPAIGVEWPLPIADVSARDAEWPLLEHVEPALRAKMGAASATCVTIEG
jgi:dTDP-4-dehydrorhamnose 3,5-epimerase